MRHNDRSTRRNTAYEKVTDRITALLEQGVCPWRRPWLAQDQPRNLVSLKPYRGINALLLSAARHSSPYFVTYKQARELGGFVRQGEKGYPIIFFRWIDRDRLDEAGEPEQLRFPVAKSFTVFNVEQCEGVKAIVPASTDRGFSTDNDAEAILAGYPNPPKVQHGGNQAAYWPKGDVVQLPPRECFDSSSAYYNTLFHELAHSTGHVSRLNRRAVAKRVTRFGSEDYSLEELVAEIGACFLTSECGLLDQEIQQSASYLNGWLHALKNDAKMIVVAAAQADKAARHILNRQGVEVVR